MKDMPKKQIITTFLLQEALTLKLSINHHPRPHHPCRRHHHHHPPKYVNV
jgi:hypothetical protein